jgi:GDP/UDP-N,N'-diacetylbacillosamine 2-epimerase (hydrolysing)
MKIGIITTSRADFGIYIPLLKKIKEKGHGLFLFVGGMHTTVEFGNSYQLIEKEGFEISEKIDGLIPGSSSESIAKSMANTLSGFALLWPKYSKILDVVFVLGDRFEMYAAASSLIPFNIPIAHLHGGETTLGAMDNKFRHAITMLSDYHFTSHEKHAQKVIEMLGGDRFVFNVGSLGVEALMTQNLFSAEEFQEKFAFDISQQFILTTIHPETVSLGKNKDYIEQFIEAIKEINLPVLCTLPNADTEGGIIREALLEFEKHYPQKIKCFENLGVKGYFTAMKNCSVLVGNTSSGIIEAASFKKLVLNLGDRQKGRYVGDNVVHVAFDKKAIVDAIEVAVMRDTSNVVNPYVQENSAEKVVQILEQIMKSKI